MICVFMLQNNKYQILQCNTIQALKTWFVHLCCKTMNTKYFNVILFKLLRHDLCIYAAKQWIPNVILFKLLKHDLCIYAAKQWIPNT